MLTKFFPYGTGEAFIENEIKVISQYYDKIVIISCEVPDSESESIRELPENVTSYRVPAGSKAKDALMGITRSFSDDVDFREESKECKNLLQKFFLSYFEEKCQRIYRYIMTNDYLRCIMNEQYMLYSYWFFMTARVGTIISNNCKKPERMFTRAHRYDLYEEKNRASYLPYRKLFLKTYNDILPCSENGTQYLKNKYPAYCKHVSTAFLGTSDHGLGKASEDGIFRIVSCSRVEPVKRVEQIIKALHLLDDEDIAIEWTHIGNGSQFEATKKIAKDNLKKINYRFLGNMKNADIMEYYRNQPVDLFVNVSSSEGLPVSVMEAISFGIPCIGTDVGGTNEIVVDLNTGKLIPSDFTAIQLAEIIKNFALKGNMSVSRMSCRDFWEKHFVAYQNYKLMFDRIMRNEK